MTPLRIEIELASPMVTPPYLIHFDSVVARLMVEEIEQAGTTPDFEQVHNTLPLARLDRDGVWCYAASAFHLHKVQPNILRHATRKTELDNLAKRIPIRNDMPKPNVLSTGSGLFKQDSYLYPLADVIKATAWCIGDKQRLLTLLPLLRYFGARRRNGHGQVKAIHVYEDDEALGNVYKRNLPWPYANHHKEAGNFRPPYWDRKGTTECFSPRELPIPQAIQNVA